MPRSEHYITIAAVAADCGLTEAEVRAVLESAMEPGQWWAGLVRWADATRTYLVTDRTDVELLEAAAAWGTNRAGT